MSLAKLRRRERKPLSGRLAGLEKFIEFPPLNVVGGEVAANKTFQKAYHWCIRGSFLVGRKTSQESSMCVGEAFYDFIDARGASRYVVIRTVGIDDGQSLIISVRELIEVRLLQARLVGPKQMRDHVPFLNILVDQAE